MPAIASDNGGFVSTLAIDENSPAFDRGVDNASVPSTDARGEPRIGAVDRGSYEFDPMQLIFRDGFENP